MLPVLDAPGNPAALEESRHFLTVQIALLADELWALDEVGDVTDDDFAPAYARFKAIQRRGVEFAESFCSMMETLNASALGTAADPDFDMADDLLDHDEDVRATWIDDFASPQDEADWWHPWIRAYDRRTPLPIVWHGMIFPTAAELERALQLGYAEQAARERREEAQLTAIVKHRGFVETIRGKLAELSKAYHAAMAGRVG